MFWSALGIDRALVSIGIYDIEGQVLQYPIGAVLFSLMVPPTVYWANRTKPAVAALRTRLTYLFGLSYAGWGYFFDAFFYDMFFFGFFKTLVCTCFMGVVVRSGAHAILAFPALALSIVWYFASLGLAQHDYTPAGISATAFWNLIMGFTGLVWVWSESRPKAVKATEPCPKCKYDLTGLSQEMPCPECGRSRGSSSERIDDEQESTPT